MPDKTTPGSPGLYLNVVSEPWEAECQCKDCYLGVGRVAISPFGGPITDQHIPCQQVIDRQCPHCHGKGTRCVRLVGMVIPFCQICRHLRFAANEAVKSTTRIDAICFEANSNFPKPCEDFNTCKDWMGIVTEAYRAGTLPAYLMASDDGPWGLRIEEVQSDAR